MAFAERSPIITPLQARSGAFISREDGIGRGAPPEAEAGWPLAPAARAGRVEPGAAAARPAAVCERIPAPKLLMSMVGTAGFEPTTSTV